MRACMLAAFSIFALAVTTIFLTGCGTSPTDAERPAFKDGSKLELAIEMPPIFPPPPRLASINTEASVLKAGQLWFRNVEEDRILLKLFVSDAKTGLRQQVGESALDGFRSLPMALDPEFTTSEFTKLSWSLRLQEGITVHQIIVGVSQ
ncbi:hypothetical protein DRQ32_12315 [bacterium]|nr:MAG: hypothetical protein DRQ32_12315 [bacterium]